MVIVAAMAVSAVHEDMHEKASDKEKIRDDAEYMRAVLFPKQNDGDRGKSQKYQKRPRCPKTRCWRTAILMLRMVMPHFATYSLYFFYSTISRPQNMPMGRESENSQGAVGMNSITTV